MNNSDDRLNLLMSECSIVDFQYAPCNRVAFIEATTIRELMKILVFIQYFNYYKLINIYKI